MTTLKDLKPGDKVIVRGPPRVQPRKATVAKVGRKLLGLEGYRSKFCLTTGVIQDGYGNSRAHTTEQWEHIERASAATKALRGWGIELTWSFKGDPVAVYEALRPLLPEAKP